MHFSQEKPGHLRLAPDNRANALLHCAPASQAGLPPPRSEWAVWHAGPAVGRAGQRVWRRAGVGSSRGMAAAVDKGADAAPPPSQKYDRQIRIWGEHGQASLERSSVCVLNAGPTGTETLKNLVLPGIGAFTIVDGAPVAAADAGNNFFVPSATHDAAGKPLGRAAAAAKSLLELNDRVDGAYVPSDPSHFLTDVASASSFFRRFAVVIAAQAGTTGATLRTIADGCRDARVPLIVVRAYGLIGSIRIQVPEMCVLDARQDSAPADLRLLRPFPALAEFVDQVDLDGISDSTTASHVPFIVILIKALSVFREKEGTDSPSSRAEKDAFAAIVASLRPSVCPDGAENFEEALKYSNLRLCYAGAEAVPENVAKVLSDALADPEAPASPSSASTPTLFPASSETPSPISLSARPNGAPAAGMAAADAIEDEIASFWLHAAAVRAFTDANEGQLPVAGALPDMTADTTSYVALQRVYRAKADADAAQVFALATKIAERRRATCRMDEESVRDFCKRLAGIRVIRYRSIAEEATNAAGSEFLEAVDRHGAADASNANSVLSFYPLIRAADRFHAEHGWYPGQRRESMTDDLRLFRDCVAKVKGEFGGALSSSSLWCDEAEEVVRFANGELHNVASYMGGVAAQEAVKIITRQFVPLNNTLVVNFSNLTSATFQA
jgi:NEDD8-activating enzyme E1 regulatory subunit